MSLSQLYEIPLKPYAQSFQIALNGSSYKLTLRYSDTDQGGWLLDLADSLSSPLIAGIPLVTGSDLLGQYRYLGLGISLIVASDVDIYTTPTYDNLGIAGHLYFWVN